MIKNLKPFKLTSSQDGVSFLMLKILNPKLAKVVGEKASIVFQHLCYWMQTQKVSTVYRTNKELVSDLEDMFSEQQIQRSKKKLIDAGMITVSFDKKNVWDRTTHYTLTEKGKEYVLSLSLENKKSNNTNNTPKTSSEVRKGASKESTYKRTNDATKAPKQVIREQNHHVSNDHPINNSKAMKESFEEGFTNKNAVKCPTDLFSLIKKKNEDVDEQPNNVEPVVDTKVEDLVETTWEDIVNAEKEMMSDLDIEDTCTQSFETTDEYISDNDYGDCEVAMMKAMSEEHSIDNHKQQEGKLSLSALMKKCFDRGFTDDQEKLYSMKMNQQHFVEDY